MESIPSSLRYYFSRSLSDDSKSIIGSDNESDKEKKIWRLLSLIDITNINDMYDLLSLDLIVLAHVQRLYLNGNRLISLPESIGNLIQLQVLDLSNNQLTSLPDSIGKLYRLKTLGLNGNLLESLPKSIWNLTKLRLLNLRRNPLRSLPDWKGQAAAGGSMSKLF